MNFSGKLEHRIEPYTVTKELKQQITLVKPLKKKKIITTDSPRVRICTINYTSRSTRSPKIFLGDH